MRYSIVECIGKLLQYESGDIYKVVAVSGFILHVEPCIYNNFNERLLSTPYPLPDSCVLIEDIYDLLKI